MIYKGQFHYSYFGEEKSEERKVLAKSSGKGMELRSEPQKAAHSSQCHLGPGQV